MDRTSQDCLTYLGLCFYCSIIYFLFLEQTLAQSYVFVIVSDGTPTPMLYGPYTRPNEKPQGFLFDDHIACEARAASTSQCKQVLGGPSTADDLRTAR